MRPTPDYVTVVIDRRQPTGTVPAIAAMPWPSERVRAPMKHPTGRYLQGRACRDTDLFRSHRQVARRGASYPLQRGQTDGINHPPPLNGFTSVSAQPTRHPSSRGRGCRGRTVRYTSALVGTRHRIRSCSLDRELIHAPQRARTIGMGVRFLTTSRRAGDGGPQGSPCCRRSLQWCAMQANRSSRCRRQPLQPWTGSSIRDRQTRWCRLPSPPMCGRLASGEEGAARGGGGWPPRGQRWRLPICLVALSSSPPIRRSAGTMAPHARGRW